MTKHAGGEARAASIVSISLRLLSVFSSWTVMPVTGATRSRQGMHVCARCEHGTSGDVWHCASEAPPSQFRAPCAAQEEMQGTARRRRFGVGVLRPLRPVGQGAGGRVWGGKEGAFVRTERMPAGMRTACTQEDE